MSPDTSLRCDHCGQGMKIAMTDTFNHRRPTFCPICGTPTLRPARHIIGHIDCADTCFAKINPELVRLLVSGYNVVDKREDPDVILPDRFIDYLKAQLEA